MLSHLTPYEVHAVIKSLHDLYVKEGKGYGDLNITLAREANDGDGEIEAVTGFVVSFDTETVTLGVGGPSIRHVQVPLSGVVRVTIER